VGKSANLGVVARLHALMQAGPAQPRAFVRGAAKARAVCHLAPLRVTLRKPRMSASPPFAAPPDVHGAEGLRTWYTDPPGAIVQLSAPARGTLGMAQWLVGPGFARLRGRFPGEQKMILVLDLSLMEGRDPAARVVIMTKAREMAGFFSRSFIVLPVKANAVYTATLHAAAAVLSSFGIDVVIARSLADVLARCNLTHAPAGDAGSE
jgi:hypothetical protein